MQDLQFGEFGHCRAVFELRENAEALLGGDMVKAPMPGKLLVLNVKPGDAVARGDALAVMEAMKMEHALAAPRDGIVESVSGKAGEQIAEGTVLVKLEDE